MNWTIRVTFLIRQSAFALIFTSIIYIYFFYFLAKKPNKQPANEYL